MTYQLAQGATSVIVNKNIPSESVHIIIKDDPKHNWAIRGKLASE
ncbi:4-oxalocrotonate tautomerase family protein [Chloroflexota bacterium]